MRISAVEPVERGVYLVAGAIEELEDRQEKEHRTPRLALLEVWLVRVVTNDQAVPDDLRPWAALIHAVTGCGTVVLDRELHLKPRYTDVAARAPGDPSS